LYTKALADTSEVTILQDKAEQQHSMASDRSQELLNKIFAASSQKTKEKGASESSESQADIDNMLKELEQLHKLVCTKSSDP
jgi:hypothetical protein